MPAKFRGISDRGEQMKHRAQNMHERHMSDVRGAVGCYYCWIGQYDRCNSSCQKVRVTDRDHDMSYSTDHRDVLRAWDRAAPVLTHASRQTNTFFNVKPPKQAEKWVQSVAGGGKQFFSRRDFVSVTTHVPEDNPWLTSSRHGANRDMLQSMSSNVHRAEADRAAAHASRHEKRLFSLLLPEQFIPKYKYPHGSVTVQATPYTQIAMSQRGNSRRSASASPSRAGGGAYGGGGGSPRAGSQWAGEQPAANYLEADPLSAARRDATEQRRANERAWQAAGRPTFMSTKHGGRYVSATSPVFSGAGARSTMSAEDEFNEETANLPQLTTAEQLRAALEGRSITALQHERAEQIRARSAGSPGRRASRLMNVKMAESAGQVLSGRYTNAMAMPLPEAFASF